MGTMTYAKKQTAAPVIMIIIMIITLCALAGCGAPMTMTEYKSDVEGAMNEWMDTISTYYSPLSAAQTESDDPIAFNAEHREEFDIAAEKIEAALDRLDSIKNPPAELAELHKELKDGVKIERRWLKYVRELWNAKDIEHYRKAEENVRELLDDARGEGVTNGKSILMVYFRMTVAWQ